MKFLEFAGQNKRPILIVAEDVDGDAITNLVLNKLRGTIQVCCVKSPGFGDNRRNTMMDIAMATGAQFISDEVGLDIEEVDVDVLGSCDHVVISKDDTIIMGGKGEPKDVADRVEQITNQLETSNSEYDKEKL